VDTAAGPRLTRAGAFTPSEAGELVNPDGHRLLDLGGAPVFVPPDARDIGIGADGTLSADGVPVAQIGLVVPEDPTSLRHEAGTLFSAGETLPASGRMRQGFLEDSNVSPVPEIARMIAVQRAYELGQRFLDAEDSRIRSVVQTLGK
jgi:flagellar basal-body rod protein FlgF